MSREQAVSSARGGARDGGIKQKRTRTHGQWHGDYGGGRVVGRDGRAYKEDK